jgi:porphobilinogen deaminase
MPVPLRGNVPTRLRKLGEGAGVEAIILAAAGLTRLQLDLTPFVVIELAPEWWVPAPGQGALAAQCRAGDRDIAAHVGSLADAGCVDATRWEREFLRVIEGGCSTPFGCHVVGTRAWLGIAAADGWLAGSVELPENFTEDSHRDEFIRGAVAGCKPIDASAVAAGTLGRALFAR